MPSYPARKTENRPPMPNRFYFQHIDDTWKVFDREHLDRNGECIPIAVCASKYYVKLISEALNVEIKLREGVR